MYREFRDSREGFDLLSAALYDDLDNYFYDDDYDDYETNDEPWYDKYGWQVT